MATIMAVTDQAASTPQVKNSEGVLEGITNKISQKALAISGIAVGSLTSIGGAIGVTLLSLKSAFITAFLVGLGIKLGVALLAISAGLVLNPLGPITIILCIFTLPAAAYCFGLPVTLPATLGMLPGGALAGYSIYDLVGRSDR